MDEFRPPQKGKVPVVLAMPIPDSGDGHRLAEYLRNLVVMGEIELFIPSQYPGQIFYEYQQGAEYPLRRTIPSSSMLATEIASKSHAEFFAKVNEQLEVTSRDAVVLFPTSSKYKIVEPKITSVTVNIPEDTFYESVMLRVNKMTFTVTIPQYPEIDPTNTKLKSRVIVASNSGDREVKASLLAGEFLGSLPIYKDGDEPTGRARRKMQIYISDAGAQEVVLLRDGEVLKRVEYAEFKKFLAEGFEREIAHEVPTMGMSNRRQEENVIIDDDVITRVCSSLAGGGYSHTRGSILVDLQEAVSSDIRARRISSPKSIEESAKDKLHDLVSSDMHGNFVLEIEADVQAIKKVSQLYKEAKPNLGKKVFGTRSLEKSIEEIVTIAVKARKKIDAIIGQYGGIDSKNLPIEEGMRLASSFLVHRNAILHLEAIKATGKRGHVAFENVIAGHSDVDIIRLVDQISDQAVSVLIRNLETIALSNGSGQLLDEVDHIHSGGLQKLQDIADGAKSKDIGMVELGLYDSSRSASSRARTRLEDEAKLHSASELATHAEIEAETKQAAIKPTEPMGRG